MRRVRFSAPGKLMLFGEHAVLHGSGCIVTAVNQRMGVTVEVLNEDIFQLNAPDVHITNYKKPLSELGKGDPSTSSGQDIPRGAKFVEIAVMNFSKKYKIKKGIKVVTSSEFSSLFGFGSSSAVTVCVIKALSVLFDIKLTNKELFDLAYKTVLDIQGKGSGFDVASAIYGGTLYFESGGKVIESLNSESLSLAIGYSGIKADTVTVINQVEKKTKSEPDVVKNIYKNMSEIVENAKEAIVKKDWAELGKLTNSNHLLLQELGVSTQKLDSMIAATKNAGAYGAKLSGAGGGDCMIGLLPPGQDQTKFAVQKAIEEVGGQVIDVSVNAEGVRVEL